VSTVLPEKELKYVQSAISLTELFETEWQEDEYIEGGFLSRGDSFLIGGESKAGKSTLLAGFNRELIIGGSFLGFKVSRPLRVLYIQAELREKRLKQRFQVAFKDVSPEHQENFKIWTTRNKILINRDIDKINYEILAFNPDVVEFDPFLNFHNLEENSSTHMGELFRMIDKIKSDHDIAIGIAQHFRKAPQDKKVKVSLLESIRGSSAMRGWADSTIAMEGRTETEYRELEFEFRNMDEPMKRIIKYNKDTKQFDWHDPIAIISRQLQEHFKSEVSTKTFIQYLLNHHGQLLSNNREKAFSIKSILLNTNIIKTRRDGKNLFISMNHK
jgi:RecA-family ATPase